MNIVDPPYSTLCALVMLSYPDNKVFISPETPMTDKRKHSERTIEERRISILYCDH